MIGGLLKSASRLALVATAGVIAGGVAAQAADLGGNCCADLEERVAELEATTARKGNRKVSLQVYGQISQQVMYWNDGGEKNTYVGEASQTKNILGFQGSAKINADWSAGYKYEFEAAYYPSEKASAVTDTGGTATTSALSLRHAYLYLKSETLGAVQLGQGSTASSSITQINLANTAPINGDYDISAWSNGFNLRPSGATGDIRNLSKVTWNNVRQNWGAAWTGTSLSRREVVKYTTPTFLGFNVQASWGEDDIWDAALRYAGEIAGFRVAAGVGYSQNSDNISNCATAVGADATNSSSRDCHAVGGSGMIMHVATGLFVGGYYSKETDKNRTAAFAAAGAALAGTSGTDTGWGMQGGIEQKWLSLGKTTIVADYARDNSGGAMDKNSPFKVSAGAFFSPDPLLPTGVASAFITSSTMTSWGVGVVQNIEAASMDLFLGYRNYSTDITLTTTAGASMKSNPVADWSTVFGGAVIKF